MNLKYATLNLRGTPRISFSREELLAMIRELEEETGVNNIMIKGAVTVLKAFEAALIKA